MKGNRNELQKIEERMNESNEDVRDSLLQNGNVRKEKNGRTIVNWHVTD